ncbi:magnesium transporter CorA family protein [Candidatus Micrarchaeota archaeon]|nr:magnesium transporter CorA family protein [Candidatus Micrarchaeota archaeon]
MIGIYSNFEEFLQEARAAGVEEDLRALFTLDVIFCEQYKDYTMVSIKDYSDSPNNLLVLSYDKNLLYSEKQITQHDFRLFKYTLQKKFGESTALTLLVLKEVLRAFSNRFDKINAQIDSFKDIHDLPKIEDTTKELRSFNNRVEDLLGLLYTLEDRKVKEFRTEYVAHDYNLLLSKAKHLQDRCRNHLQELRDIRSEIELRNTYVLNKHMEELAQIMKKLTALTLLFMIPTLITSHFGMNFAYMPELSHPLAYPTVIAVNLLLIIGVALFLHKKGWL